MNTTAHRCQFCSRCQGRLREGREYTTIPAPGKLRGSDGVKVICEKCEVKNVRKPQ